MTYSIAARCPDSGRVGVAVQSHFFAVGAVVAWVEAGVGAVATQSMAEPSYGLLGLDGMRSGGAPSAVLAELTAADADEAIRQVGMVDARGAVAAHTGARCIAEAGHVCGDGFTTQANMMRDPGVAEAMASAFETATGPLWQRLLDSLDAAEEAGGDIRGRQSAALLVSVPIATGLPGHDVEIDVRVDDHPDPLSEVRRLGVLATAYRRIDEAEGLLAAGDVAGAAVVYDEVLSAHPDNVEFAFWAGLAFASAGDVDRGRTVIGPVLRGDDAERWRELARRLPPSGLLGGDAARLLFG